MSSKLRRVPGSNTIFNKTFNSPTSRNLKESIESQSDSSIAIKSSIDTVSKKKPPSTKKNLPNLNINEEKPKTPKELLFYLLKNSLGKSLLKMESRTKDQMNNLKLVYKYFVVFDKNIDLLKKGVERKKKEDEKKLREMQAKKAKLSATPKIRSKTVQNLRRPDRENSIMSIKRNKINNDFGSKTLIRNKTERNNLDDYSKRSKTVKRLQSHYPLKTKSSKENAHTSRTVTENTPKASKIINYKMQSGFRDKVIPPNVITNPKEDNQDPDKSNENNKYNTINTSSNSRSKNRKKSIKGAERGLERRKSIKGIERGLERRKSIKGAERGLVRRKSLKASKTERTLEKRKSIKDIKAEDKKLIKKKIKIDGENKPRKSLKINNNLDQGNSPPPIIKEIEKNISNFIFNDINIINNNINTSINNSLKENNDNTNENININKIIDDKKGANNKEGQSEIKNVIKELEELNDKKPKLDEEKDEGLIIRERIRSRSKNRDKRNQDSISIDKDIEGLNDVKHMVEGVSGVLSKINNDKRSKADKKKNNNDSFMSKDMNDEENKNSIKKESEEKKPNNIRNKENQNEKNKLLNEIDKEITELIESEEKKQKLKKEQEKANSKRNSISTNNNITNSGVSEIKSNENENKDIIKNYKEDIIINDNNNSNINIFIFIFV